MNLKSFISNLACVKWKRSFQEAWGLFVFAAFFAVLFNSFYTYGIALKVPPPPNYHLQDFLKKIKKVSAYEGWKNPAPGPSSRIPVTFSLNEIPRISLLGAKNRFDQKNALFLDARSPEEYAQGHIPGALEFYANDFEKYAPLVLPQLQDKNYPIVTYCHGSSCDLSLQLARDLLEQGYTHVEVFLGGWPAWKKAGYPMDKGDQP